MRKISFAVACFLPSLAWAGWGDPATQDEWEAGELEVFDEQDQQPIIHGDDATKDDWPEAGGLIAHATGDFLGQPFEEKIYMCSSTLIESDVVLTAAHCIDEAMLEAMTAGMANIDELHFYFTREPDLTDYQMGEGAPPLPADAVRAWGLALHPDWSFEDLQEGLAENADIGLMFLEQEITDVVPADLPTHDEGDQLYLNMTLEIVGWGLQNAADAENRWDPPDEGTVAIKQQGISYINELAPYEFQVGSDDASTRKCQGDSGGPSFAQVDVEGDLEWRVVGVTSHAYSEEEMCNIGGVDTRVDFYLDWIWDEIDKAWEEGPPTPDDDDDDGNGNGDQQDDGADEDLLADGDEEASGAACGCSAASAGAGAVPVLGGLLALVVGRRRQG